LSYSPTPGSIGEELQKPPLPSVKSHDQATTMGLELVRERETTATRTASSARKRSMAAWHLPSPRLHGRSGRKRPSSLPLRPPPPSPWPAKEARRTPSQQLKTPRRLIERRSSRRCPDQNPPWIWREAANDGPPGAALGHQRGTPPLPSPDQANDCVSNPSPSPPRPAGSGRRDAVRS
jgi:hypothetical protein